MSKRVCKECQEAYLGNHEVFTVSPMLGTVCFVCGDTDWWLHNLIKDVDVIRAMLARAGGIGGFAKELKKTYDQSSPDGKAKIERQVAHLSRSV